MPTIHTIGDSHSWFGWKDIKEFHVKINHLGPRLMHSFARDKEKLVDSRIYSGLGRNDTVIYCFGEIDCRCHIAKHVSNGNHHEIITDLCSRYVDSVLHMTRYYEHEIKTAIYSVVPPIRNYGKNQNLDFPFLGSDSERLEWHRFMNHTLRRLCSQNSIVFFDVTQEYEDEHGFLKDELSDGICHVNPPDGIIRIANQLGLH